eukprot:NODE_8708_length_346_cov_144.629630_g6950_i0.p2 GENE.NODE_8708_length_346_cov_144.629630_g6950_i0~~NODE_8708_length_346_cov_144.629630_g6950_i0.p2  ORF type:complete len:85 (+),score=22.73 NODE_8708_length_346_cov_144.629630_g6950_i0:32-256(+)
MGKLQIFDKRDIWKESLYAGREELAMFESTLLLQSTVFLWRVGSTMSEYVLQVRTEANQHARDFDYITACRDHR